MTDSAHLPPPQPPASLIDWDENGLPVSKQFDDIYFSKLSGIDETRYVFIEGNRLSERWQELADQALFTIGETGFGTGLNFLTTWQHWRHSSKPASARLHFISVEKYPLQRSELQQALALWPELQELSAALIHAYPPQAFQGLTRLFFDQGRVQLSLYFGEAQRGFEELAALAFWRAGSKLQNSPAQLGSAPAAVNAWFLDGFSPAKNPDMWSEALFQALKNISAAQATFATFTSAGAVKRQLQALGFVCSKCKGFGKKREMLVGYLNDDNSMSFSNPAPEADSRTDQGQNLNFRAWKSEERKSGIKASEHSWHLIENRHATRGGGKAHKIRHCAVIGGGLAGCHTAFALAQKNIQVTLIEKNAALATQTSGNPQGAVYAKLSPHREAISDFNLAALLFANHFYDAHGFYAACGQQCGVTQLAKDRHSERIYREFCQRFANDRHFVRWLEAAETAQVCGLAGGNAALHLPRAGWLSPQKLCTSLAAANPLIQTMLSTCITRLHYQHGSGSEAGHWQLFSAGDDPILQADAVVMANAQDAKHLLPCAFLPLKTIRGQISYLPADAITRQLTSVICGEGYIAPAADNQHTFGATFTLNNHDPALSLVDHLDNLQMLEKISPALATYSQAIDSTQLDGRVGFRCSTPDYLPAVGPVPVFQEMVQRFRFLSKKANAIIDEPGAAYPHLYCNVAHGSRGLSYTPLCAEIVASLISGDFLPLPRSLYTALVPARFIIRDLIRNKLG